MIWFVFALMTAAVLAVMLVPLLRTRSTAEARVVYDLVVYQDQLAEVDRDVDRGILSAAQADSARTEIQRRMLAAAGEAQASGKTKAAPPRRIWAAAIAVAVVVPAVSFGLYAVLGSPELPDQPSAGRVAMRQAGAPAQDVGGMVERLEARLQQEPGDGRGWAMLGRSLRVMGQSAKARDAYRKAMPLLPGDEQVRMELASLLIEELPEGAPLPQQFIDIMREVLEINGSNGDALYYVGVAEAGQGHTAKARELWNRLLTQLPADSPARTEVQTELSRLK